MSINRGYRNKLEAVLNPDVEFNVVLSANGPATYDVCCFGVDSNDKISNESYTVFYNQTASPNREIVYQDINGSSYFTVNLAALPSDVVKLVFTLSIDGSGRMGDLGTHTVCFKQYGAIVEEMQLTGKDFADEKAIIDLEIYKKDNIWRVSAIARGFNGGLDALVANYGGETAEDSSEQVSAPAPAPTISLSKEERLTNQMMSKISLEKDKINLEKHIISLSKATVSLEKKFGVELGDLLANVVVVVDHSGSMSGLFRSGTVQNTYNRLVPLGLSFDDNGSLPCYLFESDYREFPELNLSNYATYVKDIITPSGYSWGGTNYAPVLEHIIYGKPAVSGGLFSKGTPAVPGLVNEKMPTLILFITDGDNSDKSKTTALLKCASEKNVFIQFVGIGNSRFAYLEQLDNLDGRKRDNTGFAKLTDLDSIDDEQLYTVILGEFANWLKHLQ